ncbi:MAG: DUF4190 domain-containing protein [Phycisphaerales bacterium]|nr:DUF4190 domain-containing protein [Phycisphaerales bacterium]
MIAPPEITYTVQLATGGAFGPVDIATLTRWATERRVPATATIVGSDGSRQIAHTMPELAPVLAPPTSAPVPDMIDTTPDSAMASMIPYRNPSALAAYYLAIFSLLPVIGIPLAIAAVVCGIVGFAKFRRDPSRKGAVHAWIGIILGAVVLLGYTVFIAMMVSVR